MNFFDVRVPFFKPVWRRVVFTGVAAGWALFELTAGSPGWGLAFGAAAAWLFYSFFVAWTDPDEEEET